MAEATLLRHECQPPVGNPLLDEYRCLTANCWKLWRRVSDDRFEPVAREDDPWLT
jgi:hypothetical protein